MRDRVGNVLIRVSKSTTGFLPNLDCTLATISPNGRFVSFSSLASNLAPGDTNGLHDVFVRDLVAGTTERVSVRTFGAQGVSASLGTSGVSDDGVVVAFVSSAPNLVDNDANGVDDVFIRSPLH
jgi:hypothetical protein